MVVPKDDKETCMSYSGVVYACCSRVNGLIFCYIMIYLKAEALLYFIFLCIRYIAEIQ